MLSSYPSLARFVPMTANNAQQVPLAKWARALKARRIELGYRSQEALALETQVGKPPKAKDSLSQRTISAIETGLQNPTAMTSARLYAYIRALQWTSQQFTEATGLDLPGTVIDPRLSFAVRVQSNGPHARLMRLREKHDLTPEQLAEKTGLSARRLRNLEENPELWPKATRTEITALAQAYGLSINDFLLEVNMTPYPAKPNVFTDTASFEGDLAYGTKRIPEYDLLKAGPGGRGGEVIGFVDFSEDAPGEQIAYRVSGHSMSPEINDNDSVIVRVQDYSSPRNTIVCWTPDDGTMVKYLKERRDDGTYVLISHNPDYPPIWAQELRIYGVVIQIRKNLTVINGNH